MVYVDVECHAKGAWRGPSLLLYGLGAHGVNPSYLRLGMLCESKGSSH
jgi:hypothetical protein